LNPPQNEKWQYSSTMRLLRAALLGQDHSVGYQQNLAIIRFERIARFGLAKKLLFFF